MAIRITVRQGDCLTKIAARHGFSNYRVIYDHPSNSEFKRRRPDPDVIYPGDVVVIPDKAPKLAQVPAGALHHFRVRPRAKRVLRIAFRTSGDEPLASVDYTLAFGGTEIEGVTDRNGVLEQEVPYDLDRAAVLIGGDQHELVVGALNPIDDTPDDGISGARARLANLGYDTPPTGDALDEPMAAVLAAFQRDHGLEATGKLDGATRGKLRSAHGS